MMKNNGRQLRQSTRQKTEKSTEDSRLRGRPSKSKSENVEKAHKPSKRKREPSSVEKMSQSNPPVKRSRRLSSSKENSSDENGSSLSSTSFYGKSRPGYLTPIQRRDIAKHKFEFPANSDNGPKSLKQTSKSEKENFSGRSSKRLSNARSNTSSGKQQNQASRSDVLKKFSPSAVIKMLELSTGTECENDSREELHTPLKPLQSHSKNKFFKHKSPGKKAKLMLAKQGVSKKGYNLSFHSKKVKNDSVTKTILEKSSDRMSVNKADPDMVLLAKNFRKNKEKLKQLRSVEAVEASDIDDLTSVRSEHVNSSPVKGAYMPDFVEDDRSMDHIADMCREHTVSVKICKNQSLHKNKEKLKQLRNAETVAVSDTNEPSSVRSDHVNSSPVKVAYVPDFAEDDTVSDQSQELKVSEVTLLDSNTDLDIDTYNGWTSAMSDCSDRWSTCSTAADSVILLLEPSSDEKQSRSPPGITLPDTVVKTRETAESAGEEEEVSRCSTEALDSPVIQGNPESVVPAASAGSNAKPSPDHSIITTDTEDDETSTDSTVNVKEKVAGKLFPIFNPAAQSSPNLRRDPCTPPGSGRRSLSETCTPKSTPGSSGRSSPKRFWRKLKDKDGMEQMMLDCGQKLLGPQPCSLCGMMYTRGDTVDESEHSKMHQRYINILRFQGWNKERVVQHLIDGSRIVMVLPQEKKCMKKVSAVMQLVDRDLGFVMKTDSGATDPVETLNSYNSKFFLYISADKRVVGFCAVQLISKGYRVLSESAIDQSMSTSPTKRQRPRCCSTKAEPARCGINRIWVLQSERRKCIASKLLDGVRCNFALGNMLKPDELAFSDPTPDGLRLASSYTGTPHFLVYKPT